ncbi:MAG: hypothetical protein C0404_03765 [Verrucomicrobia bacterium]|nr:hypothetical protein [Verrucomicrobiota bacterium]
MRARDLGLGLANRGIRRRGVAVQRVYEERVVPPLQTTESKILGVGIRMELHDAGQGGRKLYFEFRRDINCKRVFFWDRLRDVLLRKGFDIKGGFCDEEWASVPFHHGVIAGSIMAACKEYGADQIDLIKTDVQAMFDLWTDADIKDITSVEQGGAEANADMLDVAMMSVA